MTMTVNTSLLNLTTQALLGEMMKLIDGNDYTGLLYIKG